MEGLIGTGRHASKDLLYEVAFKLAPKKAEKLGGWGDICPRTLTMIGFALNLPTHVGCFKFGVRSFVRTHPHFVRVRAYTLNRCSTLQVRARSFRLLQLERNLVLNQARPRQSISVIVVVALTSVTITRRYLRRQVDLGVRIRYFRPCHRPIRPPCPIFRRIEDVGRVILPR